MEKRVVSLENGAFYIPQENTNDIGIDEAADPSLPLAQDRLYLAASGHVPSKLVVHIVKVAISGLQIAG
jgi:hypothetical protein